MFTARMIKPNRYYKEAWTQFINKHKVNPRRLTHERIPHKYIIFKQPHTIWIQVGQPFIAQSIVISSWKTAEYEVNNMSKYRIHIILFTATADHRNQIQAGFCLLVLKVFKLSTNHMIPNERKLSFCSIHFFNKVNKYSNAAFNLQPIP